MSPTPPGPTPPSSTPSRSTSPRVPPSRIPPPTPIPTAPRTAARINALDPLTTTWAAGETFTRCYDINYGSRDFYAGGAGRFHPFTPATSTRRRPHPTSARGAPDRSGARGPLPVLYGASDAIGALSETVFHDVPVRGVRRVPVAKLTHRVLIDLVSARELTLIDLTSHGLARLGLSRSELIESDARSYPATTAWAKALHAHPVRADGLLWVSRQHDTSRALVLFADRVAQDDLSVHPDTPPVALRTGAGLELVCEVADRAGITITGLAP